MSEWAIRRVTATLGSDVHLGDRPLGFVSRTLPFIPGHIPWFALIPTMARLLGRPDAPRTYAGLEGFLASCLRCTPLFLLSENRLLRPWSPEDLECIEAGFLHSRYGVALDYPSRGAIQNRLFEKEVILGRGRGCQTPTQLRGYLVFRPMKEADLEMDKDGAINGHGLEELFAASTWGGEGSKGLGRLTHVTLEPAASLFEHGTCQGGDECPVITWPADISAPVYLERHPAQDNQTPRGQAGITGNLKPLCGRRFDPRNGPGLLPDRPIIAWNPGWKSSRQVSLAIHPRTAAIIE